MKKTIQLFSFLIFICCIQFKLNAQTPLSINFYPSYGIHPLKLNTSLPFNETDSIRFEMLKFYVSNIELYNNDTVVWKTENSFHLLDYEKPSSMKIELYIPSKLHFNKLYFDLGIDSITNVSGAMGGDLDPTKGMYWTWQSGYVNFKLEGSSNVCDSYKNEFQYHIGGYQAPHSTLQPMILDIPTNIYEVNIEMMIKKFIEHIDLKNESHIMSLGKKAVQLSELTTTIFKVQ